MRKLTQKELVDEGLLKSVVAGKYSPLALAAKGAWGLTKAGGRVAKAGVVGGARAVKSSIKKDMPITSNILGGTLRAIKGETAPARRERILANKLSDISDRLDKLQDENQNGTSSAKELADLKKEEANLKRAAADLKKQK